MNTEEIRQSAIDDFLAIVKMVSVWGIKHKFGSDVDRAFKALFTGDYQEMDHFNFAFEIPRSILDSIFQKRDSTTKQTIHLNYGTIIPELEVKGEIVRFKNGGFMQNKKHPCSRYLLNKDELKKIFADGEETKKILRYWTEDSIYTIRQQKLILKLITRKNQMTDNTEQDAPVFINEAKMKIERNQRLGRAKAKRTKATNEQINELREQVALLTQQNQQLLEYLMGQKQAKEVATPKVEHKEELKPEPQAEQPKPIVDNSDIDENSGYDSEFLKQYHAKVLDFLEQNKITLGQAKMICDRMTLMPIEDRRRYKESIAANEIIDKHERLNVYQSFLRLLVFFINAKTEGRICASHYTSDPTFVKNGLTAEQKLEKAYDFAIKQRLFAEDQIYTIVGA